MMVLPLVAAGACCVSGYFSPHVLRYYQSAVARKQLSRDRVLMLTYDDGPSHELTPALLNLLDEFGAKATFFMLGRNVRTNPDVASLVSRAGHQCCCHTFDHLHPWKVSPWRAVGDIARGYEALQSCVSATAPFRPPYGRITLATWTALRLRGCSIYWWTIDSGDTRSCLPRPELIAEKACRNGGGIVLMHDLDRSLERNRFVLDTTRKLLEMAKREALQVARIGDMF